MPFGGKCVFNTDWLVNEAYKGWLRSVKEDRHSAYCMICCRKLSLANMGKAALKSHMEGAVHKNRFSELSKKTCTVASFFPTQRPEKSVQPSSTARSSTVTSQNTDTNAAHSSLGLLHLSTLSKKVIDAEIIWALKCVDSHFSSHSNIGMNDLFKKMFSDSEIAQQYSMSQTKLSYVTTFGFGPYFSRKLLEDVNNSPAYSILFDESLNDQLQCKQLDVHVRYWSSAKLQVESRYLTSLFIGHGKTEDILRHYEEATKHLDQSKVWQVGIDGPNVNLSFERELRALRKEMNLPSLILLGTCGLHIVHGAFQTGAKETDWNFDKYLLRQYKLFKDSPARREDYVTFTGVDSFPSKFCNHRWLENLPVAIKSLTNLPSMKEYCVQAAIHKAEPKKHEGYSYVKQVVMNDKLIKAKHHFWMALSQEFQSFLQCYQADKPLIPFLASDLEKLLRKVMSRFVKKETLTAASSYLRLAEIDLKSGGTTKLSKEIDIGIVTKRELNRLKEKEEISQKEKSDFEISCKKFLMRTTEKLLEKCPLKFPAVRFFKCLDPRVMAGPTSTSVKQFERLLSHLMDCNRVKETEVDDIKNEYASFVNDVVHGNAFTLLKFQNYDPIEGERIDCLLASYLKESLHSKLWELLKCLLVLSHGQAGVERGFSVNSEIMAYNYKAKSVVALRVTYDHIKQCGGVLDVTIDQELRNAVKNASSECRAEEKRGQEEKKKKENADTNKVVNDEIFALKGKHKRLLEDCSSLRGSAEELMDRAEKEKKMIHVTKANSFRRTIVEMEKETADIYEKIENLKKRIKI